MSVSLRKSGLGNLVIGGTFCAMSTEKGSSGVCRGHLCAVVCRVRLYAVVVQGTLVCCCVQGTLVSLHVHRRGLCRV